MIDDIEIISLKLLKILYYYHKQDNINSMEYNTLTNRIDFPNKDEGLKLINKALEKLVELELINQDNEGYMISDTGIKHYEQFKFIGEPYHKQGKVGNIIIYGEVKAIVNKYSSTGPPNGEKVFPDNTKEFMPHYKELRDIIKEVRTLIVGIPEEKRVLELLGNMESVLNLESSSLARENNIEDRFSGVLKWLEKKMIKEKNIKANL